jgi:hypothetical protein
MSEFVRSVVMSDDTVRGIELLAQALQRPCFVVDLGGCVDKAGLLERTAGALAFPDWFGQNWDAWFDCLVDLGWQPRAQGYVIVLRRVAELRAALPEALDTALSILGDAAKVWSERGVELRVFVEAGQRESGGAGTREGSPVSCQ